MSGFTPQQKEGILSREGGRCAMEGTPGCRGRADTANHRLNRGMGGDPTRNGTSNGCAICNTCNGLIEHDAEVAEEARRRGVKLIEGDDPERVPLWSPFWDSWLLLVDDSSYPTGIRDRRLDARLAEGWLL